MNLKIKTFLPIIKFVCTRVLFLYLFIFLGVIIFTDVKTLRAHAVSETLSRLQPDTFEHILGVEEDHQNMDKDKMGDLMHYLENVIKYMPTQADAYATLGFCYYHLGKHNKAISFYKRAIKENPFFFTFHYNLGVIYFEKGLYQEAAMVFERASATNLWDNMRYIIASRIYINMLDPSQHIGKAVKQKLKDIYSNAQILLVLSYAHLEEFDPVFRNSGEGISAGMHHQDFFNYYAGWAAYHLKQYDKAIYALQSSVSLNQHSRNAFRYLSLALTAEGKEKMANLAAERAQAMEKFPDPFDSIKDTITLKIF